MRSTSRRLGVVLALLVAFAAPLSAGTATLAWDRNPEPDVQYLVHWGTQRGVYAWKASVGAATSYMVDGLAPGRTYYFAVQAVAPDGLASPLSEEVEWTVPGTSTNSVTAVPAALKFAARKAGATGGLTAVTPGQAVTVGVTGATTWSARSNQPWVQVTNGSGTGSGQFTVSIANPNNVLGSTTQGAATITVTPSSVGLAPVTVAVYLDVTMTSGVSQPPFGQVDTPVQDAGGITGTIGITGWALDDLGVADVRIYRNCYSWEESLGACQTVGGHRVVFIGDAAFLAGARPDVEAAFPSYPLSQRGGWGYLMLTNMLPDVGSQLPFGGQGAVQIFAFAIDEDGNETLLGRTQSDHTPTSMTLANDSVSVPFGAIDTPAQGQTVSGVVANFGWVVTPDSNTADDIILPTDGSTIIVYIDGQPVGPVTYNQCRGSSTPTVPASGYCDDDIASIFGNRVPEPTFTPRWSNSTRYRNLDAGRGAIGSLLIDTRTLSNGMHTIAWGVTDSAGRTAGIGSRFFTVLNSSAGDPAVAGDAASTSVNSAAEAQAAPAQDRGEASALATLSPAATEVLARFGLDPQARFEVLAADDDGVRRVAIAELSRLELQLGAVDAGYLVVNGSLRDLPPGSSLDAGGQFTWTPGPGYVGAYNLSFVRGAEQIPVTVTIRPIAGEISREGAIRMAVDSPRTGETLSGRIDIAGWAFDPQAAAGTGIGAIQLWAQRRDAIANPIFLGLANLDAPRPDIAQAYGEQFGGAGFTLSISGLPAGQFDITAYVWSRRTGQWEDARTVSVGVR